MQLIVSLKGFSHWIFGSSKVMNARQILSDFAVQVGESSTTEVSITNQGYMWEALAQGVPAREAGQGLTCCGNEWSPRGRAHRSGSRLDAPLGSAGS